MPRGYRCILIALVGWLSLAAANPPQGRDQNAASNNASEAPIRVAVTQFPTTVDTGCNKGQEERKSDLCAEWKAADATESAARYAFVALIISGIGTLFLYMTLRSQRQTSRAELRAYVFPDTVTLFDGSDPSLRWDLAPVPNVHIVIKNFGKTPAYKVRHAGALILARLSDKGNRDE